MHGFTLDIGPGVHQAGAPGEGRNGRDNSRAVHIGQATQHGDRQTEDRARIPGAHDSARLSIFHLRKGDTQRRVTLATQSRDRRISHLDHFARVLDSESGGLALSVPVEFVANLFLIPNQEEGNPVFLDGPDGSGHSGLGSEVASHGI